MSSSSSDADLGAGRRPVAPGVTEAPPPTAPEDDGRAQPQVGVPARYRRDGKVVEGLSGRLFVANDDNGALQQYTGERVLRDWELDLWAKLFRKRLETLERVGTEYLFVLAPDSHPVYPELLPPDVESAPERPVDQLIGHLERENVPVRVLYPLDALLERKHDRVVYPETDSHWDEYGAFIAYDRVMEEITQLVPARRLSLDQVLFYEISIPGDLGYKLEPVRSSPHAIAVMRHRTARLVYDNRVENRGSFIVTECPAAPPTTCVVLGDSYTYGLLKFLAESFRRVVFGETPKLDMELIERERPDVVLNMMVERHLVGIPDDVNGESLAEFERMKLEQGRLRPLADHWAGPDEPTPAAVERLRAHLIVEGELRSATMLSVLAYGGLRPRELLRLRWSDVGDDELLVGESGAGGRRVRLFEALASDLREWQTAQARDDPDGLVFADLDDWGAWRDQVFLPAARACKLRFERPFVLRRVLCSLLLHEGVALEEVAAQMGTTAEDIYVRNTVLLSLLDQAEPVSAEDEIAAARAIPF